MDLDALLHGYLDGNAETGIDRIKVDFGLERDRGRRFALWSVLYMLGEAPDLDRLDPDDRDAARNFMDLADRAGG